MRSSKVTTTSNLLFPINAVFVWATNSYNTLSLCFRLRVWVELRHTLPPKLLTSPNARNGPSSSSPMASHSSSTGKSLSPSIPLRILHFIILIFTVRRWISFRLCVFSFFLFWKTRETEFQLNYGYWISATIVKQSWTKTKSIKMLQDFENGKSIIIFNFILTISSKLVSYTGKNTSQHLLNYYYYCLIILVDNYSIQFYSRFMRFMCFRFA